VIEFHRRGARTELWFGDRHVDAVDTYGDHHEVERQPDVTVDTSEMDALVAQWQQGTPAAHANVLSERGYRSGVSSTQERGNAPC
jgi:hypothetical protein